MKALLNQILKFGIVGIAATGIDYGIMLLLTEAFNVYYLLSNTIAFTVSLLFNYASSMRFVFHGREGMSRQREIFLFLILSLIGLALNQLIMWFGVEKLGVYYVYMKIFATIVVMIWNFITRKIYLEER